MNAWYHGGLTLAARFAGLVGGVLCAALHVSCGPPAESEHPGSSDAPYGAPASASTPPEPKPQPYPGWPSISAWPSLQAQAGDSETPPTRFASLGHGGGRFTYSVHVDPASVEAYRNLVIDHPFPEDSTLFVRLFDEKSGDPGPIYAMRKAGSKWEFAELSPDGLVVRRDAETCRRCHAEAPTDYLFGLPRSK